MRDELEQGFARALVQAQIDAARAAPTEMEIAMQEVDECIKLVGEEQLAYGEFCAAAAAVAEHQKATGPVMERYRAALARLSEQAAKR